MSYEKLSIKTWSKDDRPREKLAANGPHSLSNSELIAIIISSGSVHFESQKFKYILISLFSSLFIPLLVSIRLFLGWKHIFRRLTSEKVEYEESGWYDGKTWLKPLNLKEKESLIASIEVQPILRNLIQISSVIMILILSGILIFQYAKF